MDNDVLKRIKEQKEAGLELIATFRRYADMIDEGNPMGCALAQLAFLHIALGSPTTLAKALRNMANGLEVDPMVTRVAP